MKIRAQTYEVSKTSQVFVHMNGRNDDQSQMINFKQEELIEGLMDKIRNKFPEVRLIKIMESCEDPESLWIKVTSPEDEDRELELRAFASDKVTDILMDYGYHMLVMPMRREVV